MNEAQNHGKVMPYELVKAVYQEGDRRTLGEKMMPYGTTAASIGTLAGIVAHGGTASAAFHSSQGATVFEYHVASSETHAVSESTPTLFDQDDQATGVPVTVVHEATETAAPSHVVTTFPEGDSVYNVLVGNGITPSAQNIDAVLGADGSPNPYTMEPGTLPIPTAVAAQAAPSSSVAEALATAESSASGTVAAMLPDGGSVYQVLADNGIAPSALNIDQTLEALGNPNPNLMQPGQIQIPTEVAAQAAPGTAIASEVTTQATATDSIKTVVEQGSDMANTLTAIGIPPTPANIAATLTSNHIQNPNEELPGSIIIPPAVVATAQPSSTASKAVSETNPTSAAGPTLYSQPPAPAQTITATPAPTPSSTESTSSGTVVTAPSAETTVNYDIDSSVLGHANLSAAQFTYALGHIHDGTMEPYAADIIANQDSTNINELYTAAAMAQESTYATSFYATNRNNFFGIGAFDSDPNNAYSFPSAAAGIAGFTQQLTQNYLYAGGQYYNGPTLHGIYTDYSSSHDIEAGSIASIMNSIETLGLQDPQVAAPTTPTTAQTPPTTSEYSASNPEPIADITETPFMTYLAKAAMTNANQMTAQKEAAGLPTYGWCLEGVDNAFQSIGIDVPRIGSAANMNPVLAADSRFKQVYLNPADTDSFPAGIITVFPASSAYPNGHISISLGGLDGHISTPQGVPTNGEASDHIQWSIDNWPGGTPSYYVPTIASVPETPTTPIAPASSPTTAASAPSSTPTRSGASGTTIPLTAAPTTTTPTTQPTNSTTSPTATASNTTNVTLPAAALLLQHHVQQ